MKVFTDQMIRLAIDLLCRRILFHAAFAVPQLYRFTIISDRNMFVSEIVPIRSRVKILEELVGDKVDRTLIFSG